MKQVLKNRRMRGRGFVGNEKEQDKVQGKSR